jgi:hypothetical protein
MTATSPVSSLACHGQSAAPWTSCPRCNWSGGPHDYRCLEYWTEPFGGPGFWTIRPTCPTCGARVPRR